MKKALLISLPLLVLALALYFSQSRPHEAGFALPALHTQGNEIVSSTGNQVVFHSITSDYFRYGFNSDYPEKYGGLEEEFARLEALRARGAEVNTVILYLSSLSAIKAHLDDLDHYIAYGKEHGYYIVLAPTGLGFLETNPKKLVMNSDYWKDVHENDLASLWQLLASRYGQDSHVLFYLTAEPNIHDDAWEPLEARLGELVRHKSSNIIIVSTPYYSTYPNELLFSDQNIVYSTGGYMHEKDGARLERTLESILGTSSLQTRFPVFVTEFGGNWGSNLGSTEDVSYFTHILNQINQKNLSYSVYRLSAAFENDGLALFTTKNALTPKGEALIKLSKTP